MEYTPNKPHGHTVTSDPYFTLMANDDGEGYVHCGDGVLIVPMTPDGRVLMAVERSAAFNREVLIVAGGQVESGEPLEETANRELQEELGWRAQRIDYLGEIHIFKYFTSRQFVFLARDLVPSKLIGDERYPVGSRSILLDSYIDLCASGELQDAPSIAALCLARHFLPKNM
ncbi:MAG TPA: NUDIX domain-containing protein [Ktedonobacteraceae bacterium]